MKKLLGFFGMTIGGWAGWWLGAFVGFGTAAVVSAIGSGLGLYLVHKLAENYLEQ